MNESLHTLQHGVYHLHLNSR